MSRDLTHHCGQVEELPERVLHRFVDLHEGDVGAVPEEEDERLPPHDEVVLEEDDEHHQRDGVEEHVTDQRPGGQAAQGEEIKRLGFFFLCF